MGQPMLQQGLLPIVPLEMIQQMIGVEQEIESARMVLLSMSIQQGMISISIQLIQEQKILELI
jgi:hypothetical protein